jgi:hypothetical protein
MNTLFDVLPRDLCCLILAYCPAMAIELPASERIQVVRILSGKTIPAERTPVVLEQLDTGNRDWANPELSQEEWIEALMGTYSLRAYEALVESGALVSVDKTTEYLTAAMIQDKVDMHLITSVMVPGSAHDILCGCIEDIDPHVKDPVLIQYWLARCLDPNDPCVTNQEAIYGFDSPMEKLVLRIFPSVALAFPDTWSQIPLLNALLCKHPAEASTILMRCWTEHVMTSDTLDTRLPDMLMRDFPGLVGRPPHTFSCQVDAVSGNLVVVFKHRQIHTEDVDLPHPMQPWIADDWLEHALLSDSSEHLGQLLSNLDIDYARTLLQRIPHHMMLDLSHEELKDIVVGDLLVPRLIQAVPWDTWLAVYTNLARDGNTERASSLFLPQQRVQLNRLADVHTADVRTADVRMADE